MSKKYLGLDEMSRGDQLRVGLVGMALLALECVLAGLVTDSAVRGWIVHALAAGLTVWALTELKPIAIRFAGFAAVLAVFNEALLIAEAQQSMKYLLPSSLLLAVSGWVLERSFTASSPIDEVSDAWVSPNTDLGVNELQPKSALTNLWAPVIAVFGIFVTLFGFLEADWVQAKFLFGLFSNNLTYSEIRLLWDDFGAPSMIAKAYVSLSHILGYFAMLIAAVGAISGIIRQFEIPQPWRVVGVVTVGIASFMQTVVVVGLLSAESNIVVQGGAWLAPLGLAMATLGFWAASA